MSIYITPIYQSKANLFRIQKFQHNTSNQNIFSLRDYGTELIQCQYYYTKFLRGINISYTFSVCHSFHYFKWHLFMNNVQYLIITRQQSYNNFESELILIQNEYFRKVYRLWEKAVPNNDSLMVKSRSWRSTSSQSLI